MLKYHMYQDMNTSDKVMYGPVSWDEDHSYISEHISIVNGISYYHCMNVAYKKIIMRMSKRL